MQQRLHHAVPVPVLDCLGLVTSPPVEPLAREPVVFALQALPSLLVEPDEGQVDEDAVRVVAHDAPVAQVVLDLLQFLLQSPLPVSREFGGLFLQIDFELGVLREDRLLHEQPGQRVVPRLLPSGEQVREAGGRIQLGGGFGETGKHHLGGLEVERHDAACPVVSLPPSVPEITERRGHPGRGRGRDVEHTVVRVAARPDRPHEMVLDGDELPVRRTGLSPRDLDQDQPLVRAVTDLDIGLASRCVAASAVRPVVDDFAAPPLQGGPEVFGQHLLKLGGCVKVVVLARHERSLSWPPKGVKPSRTSDSVGVKLAEPGKYRARRGTVRWTVRG